MNNHWSKQKKKDLYNKIVLSELFNSELKFISKSIIRIRKTVMCISHKKSTINISKYNKNRIRVDILRHKWTYFERMLCKFAVFILTDVK